MSWLEGLRTRPPTAPWPSALTGFTDSPRKEKGKVDNLLPFIDVVWKGLQTCESASEPGAFVGYHVHRSPSGRYRSLQLEEAAVVEGVRWYDLPSFESYWPMQGVDGELQMQG